MTTVPDHLAGALAGRYRVERELGRGGMATVYAAEDLRHRRPVAIKVLHPELGAVLGGERFLREIEVTARLRHPHILPLHDSGEADGLLYYVMPYVKGESLRERLRRERQLPVDDAVRIAREVAGALDSAHRHNVIHRDVKPENILLDDDGHAAVADFGVARALQRAAGGDTLTATGVAVGTPQYMSPEQASGDGEIGPRSDVWALGCVLYEMLAGEPPFTGASAQSIAAKVMTETPRPVSQVRQTVPPHVAVAVGRALEKVPADRFATAAQFAAALQAPADSASWSPSAGATTARHVPRGPWLRRAVPWAVGLVAGAVIGLAAAAAWRSLRPAPAGPPARFTLSMAGTERLDADGLAPLAISPDGRSIAYVGRSAAGRSMLYLRPLDELRAHPIPGTEGTVWAPFFSPDGRWLGFIDNFRVLKKVSTTGGPAITVVQAPDSVFLVDGGWQPNDVIVLGSNRGLLRVPSTGGTLQRITVPDTARGELGHGQLRVLPDGKTIVFGIVDKNLDFSGLGVASLDATGFTRLDVDGQLPLGFLDGRLVFGRRGGTIAAVPFDVAHRRVTGEPVTVLEGALGHRSGIVAASLSGNGSLVYAASSDLRLLSVIDERGNPIAGSEEPRPFGSPRVSPDGRRVAVELTAPDSGSRIEAWVYDLTSGVLSRLTSQGAAYQPSWSADGRYILYLSERGGPRELWRVPADGSGPEERVYALPDTQAISGQTISEMTVSPDGRYVVLVVRSSEQAEDLWLLPLAPGAADDDNAAPHPLEARPLVHTAFRELTPDVSPDGRWLAYSSNETGQYEVYVRAVDGAGGRLQVSSGGGTEPVWAPDGRRLLYRAAGRFMAARIATSPGLAVAGREPLFEDRYRAYPDHQQYDVLANGKHFVVLRPTGADQEIIVVVNWLQEFRSRMGAQAR